MFLLHLLFSRLLLLGGVIIPPYSSSLSPALAPSLPSAPSPTPLRLRPCLPDLRFSDSSLSLLRFLNKFLFKVFFSRNFVTWMLPRFAVLARQVSLLCSLFFWSACVKARRDGGSALFSVLSVFMHERLCEETMFVIGGEETDSRPLASLRAARCGHITISCWTCLVEDLFCRRASSSRR